MTDRPELARLAERLGLAASYLPAGERRPREISAETLAALAGALGWPAETEADAGHSLASMDARDADGEAGSKVRVIHAHQPCELTFAAAAGGGAEAILTPEDGGEPQALAARTRERRFHVRLPSLPVGRYRLVLAAPGGLAVSATELIVAPATCTTPAEILGDSRAFGLWCSLYSLRREHDLGHGDLGHLRELAALAAAGGADFVGVNPLHALDPTGRDPSPYSPLSRLFRNPLYLDVERIGGFAEDGQARRLFDASTRALGPASRRRVDYGASLAAREPLLRRLHDAFRRRPDHDPLRRDFERFRYRAGSLLEDFATFLALREHHDGSDWQRWPARFRDRDGDAVRAFREHHADRVHFHAWAQFELDRQLADVAKAAGDAGLRIGLYQDLAVGSAPGGFDTWAFPDLFVAGARLGAPPDDYAPGGQDWGLPPLHPLRLRGDGYRFWQRLLEANLAHAGALRIDHVLGLFRQWWVPLGRGATDGGYVRFPANELLAVAALASHRSGALIVGEDLGTVSPEVPARLARHGLLSSRVMLFERERDGRFRPPQKYSPRALVTANTHDHPTLEGWWRGRDLELLAGLGRLDADGLARGRQQRSRDREALLRRLRRDRALEPDAGAHGTSRAPIAPVYGWLARTPSPLLGVSVDDLAGEIEPVNIPGVSQSEHPSWTRRMDATLAELDDRGAGTVLGRVRRERGR